MKKPLLVIAVFAFCAFNLMHAASPVIITEFMAANSTTLSDEDGDFEDWVEIHNPGIAPINLMNWSLTDSATDLTRWRFPATNLNGGAYLVVFASGKDRRVPGARLHTNFKLGNSGEYLALVESDGVTKASEFAPAFPPQVTDVSFGSGVDRSDFTLVSTNAAVRVRVPADDTLGLTWTTAGFDDTTWREGTNGVGYDTGVMEPAEDSFAASVAGAGPIAYWRFSEATGTVATNRGSLGAAANGTHVGGVTLNQAGPRPPALGGFESNNAAALLNGTSARVQVPDVSAFDFGTGPYTIAMWFNPVNAAVRGDLFTYKASGNDYGIHMASQGANTVSVYHNGFIGTAGNVVNGQWHFLVVTREAGGRTTAWLNGVVILTGTDSGSMSIAMDLLIGCNHAGTPSTPSYAFNGLIDEVAIYSRALTTNEIQQQYRVATAGGVSYAPFLAADIRAEMSAVNSSAYLRIPFVVTNVADVSRLMLRMRYDDGFVAYINGVEATAANAPDVTAWNSAALALHPDPAALQFEEFNITDARGALVAGTNVLALQGLNIRSNNADFFIQAELNATTFSTYSASPRYFTLPTPGEPNGAGTADLGPIITHVGFTPAPPLKPADTDDITVTARVVRAFSPVTNVVLRYRVNYGATNQLFMADDGAHGDGAAGDGIFGAIIPASTSTSGQMVRFCVAAQDAMGRSSRWPLFEDPLNSPEYLGTVIANPAVTSAMPIWEWFAENVANARTRTGSRGALWFNGEFYDNIFVRLRGGYTATGSQKFDFNTGDHVKINDEVGRVEEANLNATGSDPSYIRQPMAFEAFRLGASPASVSFHVLMRVNGAADRVGIFIEQVDERFLERNGFDREGALYKFVQRASGAPVFSDSTDGVEKKTRLNENNSDLQAFVDGLNQTNPVAQRAWFFDNVNVPNFLNYCALRSITQDADDVRKNFYWHRDTLGNKEWSVFPWDKDWTFGIQGDSAPVLTHPFFGDYVHRKVGTDQWNRLYEFVFNDPVTRPLMLRRLRTVMDQMLQPPGTPATNGFFEQRTIEWMQPVARELGTSVSNQITGVLSFFPQRRTDLYVTFAATNTLASPSNALVPLPTPESALPSFGLLEVNPVSGNQAEEFIQLTNPTPFALDVSGWQLDGAVQFTFRPGTIIPGAGSLYVSPDVNAFRARAAGPRGGQGLLVQGNYRGQLSARGETVRLKHSEGWLVREVSYPGTPSLAQQYLRITELMYSPLAMTGDTNGAQEFEFIELKNTSASTTLDLNGVRFVNGVEFSFTGSAVTNLAPGATVVVVKNLVAFAGRYGSGLSVAGQYSGLLENGGERIQLVEASGEEILDFSYENDWYPITDGLGFSLVVVNENAEPDAWGDKSNWRAGGQLNGSPGAADPGPPAIIPVVISEALTRSDTPPPTDSIELYNPTDTDANIGGWFLTDDPGTPGKYRVPDGTIIPAGSYRVFDEADFNPGGTGFALGADGDEVYLFSADSLGNLTGYLHGHRFDAAEDDVTFGRLITSEGEEHFVAQARQSLGTNNAGPLVGPVVINEIMYHPPEVNGSIDNTDDEFIELLNIAPDVVPLYLTNWPIHTWKITGGAGFTFPTNVWLSAGEAILLVNFNPTNATLLNGFRAKYRVSAGVQIFGPYSGKLNNDADDVELRKPTVFVGDTVGEVLVDKVDFKDSAPWPEGADGFGLSLQRKDSSAYGNEPNNWVALSPTAAGATSSSGTVPTITGQPTSQTVLAFSSLTLTVSATGDEPLRYQWRRNGMDISGETNATLVMASLLPQYAGDYRAVVYNPAGSAVSSNATIKLIFPASIVLPPQGLAVFPRTNVTFSVTAWSDTPLTYQWRFNGENIGGATHSTYSITNVQPSDDGDYSVVVTDSVGPNVSPPARLTVFDHPVFTLQPTNRMVVLITPFTNVTMRAAAVSGTPIRYQWLFNGVVVPEATNSTQIFSNLTVSSSGDYAVVATDTYGSATSTNGALLIAVRPTIVQQPQNLTVLSGQDAVFTVAVNGTTPMGFRWRRNVSNITNGTPGAIVQSDGTSSTLTMTSVDYVNNNDRYTVVITNIAGSAPVSSTAILGVLHRPVFITEPTNLLANAGTNVTLRAVFQANPSGSYAWWFNETNLLLSDTNSTSLSRFTNSLTLSNLQAAAEGLYTLVLSNDYGVTTSTGAVLALRKPPTIVTQPQSQKVAAGSDVTFTVGVSGTPPFRYAWNFNGTNLPSAIGTNALLTLTNVQPAQAGDYFVVVTNTLGGVMSEVATLAVHVAPEIQNFSFDPVSDQLRFSVATAPGVTYLIVYKNHLDDPEWQTLRSIEGDGAVVTIEDPVPPPPSQRFYQVRTQ